MPRYLIIRQQDGWVVCSDDRRVIARSDRKREAAARGRELLREHGGGELVIHRASGRLHEVDRIVGNAPAG